MIDNQQTTISNANSWYSIALLLCMYIYMIIVLPGIELINIGCQLDEPYGFPGDHKPDATML